VVLGIGFAFGGCSSAEEQDTGKTLGERCAADGDCKSSLRCAREDDVGEHLCTKTCERSADCPSQGFCQAGNCVLVCTGNASLCPATTHCYDWAGGTSYCLDHD
jgi:hypothetical protein